MKPEAVAAGGGAFRVKAFRPDKGVATLDIRGDSLDDARQRLLREGYRILAVAPSRRLPGQGLLAGRDRFNLLLLSQDLLSLTEAGISLIEAIDALQRTAGDAATRGVLGRIAERLREGKSLSDALATMPERFPDLYVATVRSSEHTGDLAKALGRYIDYRLRLDALKSKLAAASVYPVLLLAVGGLVILFLLGYVIPRFSHVYQGIGGDLPWAARWLMAWGQAVERHALAVSLAIGGTLAAAAYALGRPRLRERLLQAMWDVPAIGAKFRLYQLSRLTRTLAMLLSAGIPVVTALGMVPSLLRQPALRDGLAGATQAIREGRPVSEAFRDHGLATEVGFKMLSVAERSGELGAMMDRLAHYYDQQITRDVEWLSRLIEPVLMIAIGLVIGVIVLLMYMPVFELAGAFK